jgi:hypothetical protein
MEHQSAVNKLSGLKDCPGNVCGTFGKQQSKNSQWHNLFPLLTGQSLTCFFNVTAGQAIAPLLAASDQCAQQDMADKIIDAAKVSA